MKLTLPALMPVLLLVAVALATGCTTDKKTTTAPMHSTALNITPAPAATYTPPPAPQPVVADAKDEQPVIADSVADASDTIAPAPPAHAARAQVASHHASPAIAGSSVKGTKYVIKKGDSLWSIAVAKYGNGNKWKQIAAANPKINPDKVIVGQTITLP